MFEPGQRRHKRLGIFHRIKVTKLCQQQNQTFKSLTMALALSNPCQQCLWCVHDWANDSADSGSDLNDSMDCFKRKR